LIYVFYGHLVYFGFVWYILGSFGIFSRFGMFYKEKSGNTVQLSATRNREKTGGCTFYLG
jgi:hypothetical protein